MNKEQIIAAFRKLSVSDMADAIGWFREIYDDKYRTEYRDLAIHNERGNISFKIFEETGFSCYHIPSQGNAGIGRNIVCIPLSKWTEELVKELKEKYDSFKD